MFQKHKWAETILVYGLVILCTAVLVSLCFNDGLDYDESFSYSIIRDNSFFRIPEGLLASPFSDVIPLWYMMLKAWTMIFGDSFVVCKMFTVAGNTATMLLGATVVRKNWGFKTAVLFIVPAGLAPGLQHIGVNIRMYSWTVFLVTACALCAYEIQKNSKKWQLWVLFFLLTVSGLFCHHFTGFSYLFIYLYLLIELCKHDKKAIWKVVVCGIFALVPFAVWLSISNFFALRSNTGMRFDSKLNLYEFFQFVFQTSIPKSMEIGVSIFVLTAIMFFLLRKRFQERERGFVVTCLLSFILSYVLSAIMASFSAHFIIPRHTMHALALLWLGIAIVLPRINTAICVFGMSYLVAMCGAAYSYQHNVEYLTIPYLEETEAFIAENMMPGDVVIYNVDGMFATLYGCYMPQQEFMNFFQLSDEDIQALAGKRVWFFLCRPDFFTEEQESQFHITYENMGHYGFQIISDCTDFDLLRIEVQGRENVQ